jgi:hypothetical protein
MSAERRLSMKAAALIVAVVLVIASGASGPAFGKEPDIPVTADILIVRPVSLAATVVGTALFFVSLPFSIPSDSVETAAKKLVEEPFRYTFMRPVGGFDEDREIDAAKEKSKDAKDVR